jgi:hypothetical protein
LCQSAGHTALHGPVNTLTQNFGTQLCQSAGHTVLHGPVITLTQNFGTQLCQSAGRTALHGPVSTLTQNFRTQLCQSAGRTALHGHVSTLTHNFGTKLCQSAGHTALNGPVSTLTHNFGTQLCQSVGHTIICKECDAHLSYNSEIYFHVCIYLFICSLLNSMLSRINQEHFFHSRVAWSVHRVGQPFLLCTQTVTIQTVLILEVFLTLFTKIPARPINKTVALPNIIVMVILTNA